MPWKPKQFVPPGTKNRKERARDYDKQRGSTAKRGYGSRWQRARECYLKEHPTCVECEKTGQITKATDVDHHVPHRGDMELFWDSDNWSALCASCHARKTRRGQ